MNTHQQIHPQDAVTIVAALLGFVAMHVGEMAASGIMIGAATVGAVLTVYRIRVIG
ncbi:hypothetical protein [Halococcus saccharolyticus]|uniref:hypothetical protein n=1 Tax=Halococcus saccharolyticus TaxID=62319 RepID=UPI000B01C4A2|nr:hypothetical protein [Halococcus saccharolyticus]